MWRLGFALILAIMTQPAAAQLFWQPPDFSGTPIIAGEPGIGIVLPGATPEEERANYVWQMRAGLNVMALQCQFEPTLLASNSYNGILINHKDELARAYAVLTRYFARTNVTPKGGRDALDRYGTRTYLGFSTVSAQVSYCQTAATIAKSLLFAPRGSFAVATIERLRELRNSLVRGGEQQFRLSTAQHKAPLPDMGKKCWDRRDNYTGRCAYIG
jgi:hypothetical protein